MRLLLFAACFLFAGLLQGVETRGFRNKNPGNLRPNNIHDLSKWPGAIGVDSEGHLIFARDIDGIRAIVIVLKKYRAKGIRSPHGIVWRWAGKKANVIDKQNYVKVMRERLGVYEWSLLNMDSAETLEKITKSIIYFENGKDPYPDKLYNSVFPKRTK